ncbi:hypothetical protein C8Q73DRAFT_795551 [Cubamyces lactineus]|nr:hypothetical protein C8Q73DRAFT_795551 [Cubamyces lactineus]
MKSQTPVMTVDLRNTLAGRITADLRLLFRISLLWFSFLNIPLFFSSLMNPIERRNIQPSLVLATLALSTLLQSSKLERGAKGMNRALHLLDQAYAAFHASVASGRIDLGLVQAAYVLAAFEMQAHSKGSRERTREAMIMLDSLIRYLSLTTLDVENPRTTIFLPNAVPRVATGTHSAIPLLPACDPLATAVLPFADNDEVPQIAQAQSTAASTAATGVPNVVGLCSCHLYTLGHQWPLARDFAPQFAQMPMWPRDASEGEMYKEECRRVVWASVILVTALHQTKVAASVDASWEAEHLWIKDPANYALLFPGESLAPPGSLVIASSKDSVWALYIRALLLWHSCLRTRSDPVMSDADRAGYALSAWAEADAIEEALDRHSCMIESGFCVKTREVLFRTRMCVSYEFQRSRAISVPGVHMYRDKAEQWMHHQMHVASYFMGCIQNPKTNIANHARRNFLVAWLMSQITRSVYFL